MTFNGNVFVENSHERIYCNKPVLLDIQKRLGEKTVKANVYDTTSDLLPKYIGWSIC